MLLAARALAEEAKNTTLTVNGQPHQGQLMRLAVAGRAQGRRDRRSPTRASPVGAVVSVVGAALTPEPAVSKGFTIERTYYTLDGKKVDLKSATGGTTSSSRTSAWWWC